MATAESTPQSSPEGKSKERKIYPMTEEIYERGEDVAYQTFMRLEKEKAAKRAQQAAEGQQQG